MERLTKKEEMQIKHDIIVELQNAIKEVEMTLEEDGELTNRVDGQELLYRLKDAVWLLEKYYTDEDIILRYCFRNSKDYN